MLLARYFCIFNFEYLSRCAYKKLHLFKSILLETNVSVLIDNLYYRNNREYSMKEIKKY